MNAVIEIVSQGPEQTEAVAGALAPELRDGDLVVLAGDLGAGKTRFTKGLAAGLGVTETVTSPTFTLVNRYDDGRLVLHHLDVYRLDDLSETLDLDLPELLESGVTVIEWGDEIDAVLPADHLTVRIEHGADDDERRIRFEPGGAEWAQRLERFEPASAEVQ